MEHHLKERFPAIAWVGVEVKGAKATVRVAEKKLPVPGYTNPAHVVARKAGLIRELLVLEGQPLVREGDTVLPGQVLISGEVVPGDEGESGIARGRPRYTRARGMCGRGSGTKVTGKLFLWSEVRALAGAPPRELSVSANENFAFSVRKRHHTHVTRLR